jgi:cell division protein FtsB
MGKRQQGILRLLGMRTVLVANVAVAVLLGRGFVGEYVRDRELQRSIDALQREADALAEHNRLLASAAATFTSADTVEREARLKLGLQKPGESVVVVEGTAHAQQGRTVTRPDGSAHLASNPEKWWSYFFH